MTIVIEFLQTSFFYDAIREAFATLLLMLLLLKFQFPWLLCRHRRRRHHHCRRRQDVVSWNITFWHQIGVQKQYKMFIFKHCSLVFYALLLIWRIVHVIPYKLQDAKQRDNLWLANCLPNSFLFLCWVSLIRLFHFHLFFFLLATFVLCNVMQPKRATTIAGCNNVNGFQNDDTKLCALWFDLYKYNI